MRSRPMALVDLFAAYKTRKLIGCRENTEGKYLRTIELAGEVLGRKPMVRDLSDELVLATMARKAAKGRSPATVNDVRKTLVALWAWAAKKGLTKIWPDVDRLHVPEAAPVAWTADELRRLFLAAEKAPGEMYGVPCCKLWPALLCVLWDTGERIGAILNLPKSALSGQWLTVPAKFRKGQTRDRVYKLHPETLEKLAALDSYHEDRLIPLLFCQRAYDVRFRRVLTAAGLPQTRKHMFHCIRRSVTSHLAAAGKDATAALDHANEATTRRHYLDPRIAKVAGPVDVVARPQAGDVSEGEKYSPEELRRLHEAFTAKDGDVLGVPAAIWWSVFALFTRDTATYPAGVKALPWAAFDLDRQEFDSRPFVCNVIRPYFAHLGDDTARLLRRYPVPREAGPFAVRGKTVVQSDQRFRQLLKLAGIPRERQAEPFTVYRRSILTHASGPQGQWLMAPVVQFAE